MVDVILQDYESSSIDEMPNPLLSRCRLGECEVCGMKSAKYTCPACQVKTCSAACVSVHKKELQCTGVRNPVLFKRLGHFTDSDLLSDYRLLEEMGRSVEKVVKTRQHFHKNMALKWHKLKSAVAERGIMLQYLPPRFIRHVNNTTYLDWSTGIVHWKIEWFFPQSNEPTQPLIDTRVDESCIVSEVLQKHLSNEENSEKLKPYLEAGGLSAVKVLMKAERISGPPKHMMINPEVSVGENLPGKLIIEHPTFHVVLLSDIQNYHVVPPESVMVREGLKGRKRRLSGSCPKRDHNLRFFSDQLSDSD